MPRPVDASRDSHAQSNGSQPKRATPLTTRPAQAAESASSLVGRLVAGTSNDGVTVPVKRLAALFRELAALLESAESTAAHRPSSGDRLPNQHFGSGVTNDLSPDSTSLLRILVDHRKEVETSAPDHAWLSKTKWLGDAGMYRRRRNAPMLIHELINASFVERRMGPSGKREQFRATTSGARYIDSVPALNVHDSPPSATNSHVLRQR